MKDSIILALDFDAFYCGVEEKLNPSLKGKPFIVYQKNCVATLSYAARALGIKKLDTVTNVLKSFPNITLINGEDLSKYKTEGNNICSHISKQVFSCKTTTTTTVDDSQFECVNNGGSVGRVEIERLGMEEMWIDVSDIIDYNCERLIQTYPGLCTITSCNYEVTDEMSEGWELFLKDNEESFPFEDFDHESLLHPHTFSFTANDFFFQSPATIVHPPSMMTTTDFANFLPLNQKNLDLKLYIASFIGNYLREYISLQLGYSCSVGIATNKALAKMSCSMNKPFGLSLCLSSTDKRKKQFIDPWPLSKIPSFGLKMRREILQYINNNQSLAPTLYTDKDLTAKLITDNLTFSQFTKALSNIIPNPDRISFLWKLLHGNDTSKIKNIYIQIDPLNQNTNNLLSIYNPVILPKNQISVEDTYGKSVNSIIKRKTISSVVELKKEFIRLVQNLLNEVYNTLINKETVDWHIYPTSFTLKISFNFTNRVETSSRYHPQVLNKSKTIRIIADEKDNLNFYQTVARLYQISQTQKSKLENDICNLVFFPTYLQIIKSTAQSDIDLKTFPRIYMINLGVTGFSQTLKSINLKQNKSKIDYHHQTTVDDMFTKSSTSIKKPFSQSAQPIKKRKGTKSLDDFFVSLKKQK